MDGYKSPGRLYWMDNHPSTGLRISLLAGAAGGMLLRPVPQVYFTSKCIFVFQFSLGWIQDTGRESRRVSRPRDMHTFTHTSDTQMHTPVSIMAQLVSKTSSVSVIWGTQGFLRDLCSIQASLENQQCLSVLQNPGFPPCLDRGWGMGKQECLVHSVALFFTQSWL